ncbi:MAG: pseudouridine-5'-phosphate glycosidase [Eubacteriales bacterium]|nr:pseudouridine-5'-phosphate glycosidase [Eubacteriales bacterium]
MGKIASDFYNRFYRIDTMESPFSAGELLRMASLDVQEEYAGWLEDDSSEDYIPGDMLLALIRDRAFFAEVLRMRDAGEYVVLSGVTLGITTEHIEKMGITPEDVAENIAYFFENEDHVVPVLRSAMAGSPAEVSGLCIFANGWLGVETECAVESAWNGEEEEDESAGMNEEFEPSTSYIFSNDGELVATPDLHYDIDSWMDFVDLFSAIHEEASAVEDEFAAAQDDEYGSEYIVYSKEVEEAIQEGRPVVVIESAATFAGMIYPGISDFAFRMRNTIRECGATPAFTAIINGQIHIGLTDDEVRYLETKRGSIHKASARDIPILLAMKADGVMTIAAAVQVASMVGLYVACGSGIGGAQIGAEKTMDISTDLQSLAKNTVMVVCSGTKPILDLNLTMEYLETAGVPVIGYKTDRMPEYMVRGSGFRLTYRMNTARELAEVMKIKAKMGIPGGVLVVNPVPKDYELDPEKTRHAVDAAMDDANKINVRGKAITGYMMGRIKEYLGSESVESQKAFLINNAKLAARIAAEIRK